MINRQDASLNHLKKKNNSSFPNCSLLMTINDIYNKKQVKSYESESDNASSNIKLKIILIL